MRITQNLFKISDCYLIDLPQIHDPSGQLTAINGMLEIPFPIARVYYTYNIPDMAFRGGHAHKELQEIVIAISGSFEVEIKDGRSKKLIKLDRPDQGLYLAPGIWRELQSFSNNAICLVLADIVFDPDDYIRDYKNYLKYKRVE